MAKLKKHAPARPDMLRVGVVGPPIGVDVEKGIIRGLVVAQEGEFKSPGRGEFDMASLKEIARIGNATEKGLRSRFQHPTDSDDGLGKYLGRVTGFRLDKVNALPYDGSPRRVVNAVRGDLTLSPTSFDTPSGDIGHYVLRLATEDPDALSTSIMIKADKEYRKDKQGRPLTDKNGVELPPIWRPQFLTAVDVVDTGDAVDGMLSIDDLPDALQRRVSQALDRFFDGQPLDVVRSRCEAYLDRYLAMFKENHPEQGSGGTSSHRSERMAELKRKLEEESLTLRKRQA